MDFGFRYYQKEADEAIYNELLINDKCIVKMFCGTGKSRLMRYCRVAQNKNLVVYVVPSLSLLEQFYTDYLKDFPLVQRISCEEGSTTDKKDIVKFLKKKENKIICVTYQSFETLISALCDIKIDVCIFDEAHHAIGKTYQSLIFETNVCEKQIFFTATPKNANGVVMYDKDNLDTGKCGKLVYDYSYFKGAMEGYLNPFEIRINFYTENSNNSIYESISRDILSSSNSRILTFHADVNGDRDTSVLQFVNEELFIIAFNKVLNDEFPEKIGYYKRVKMIGLSAEIDMRDRKRILTQFDTTPDDEVFIISSCQTIGEGIDTKNANGVVFVDPKSSIVSITQNFGRVVRKIFGVNKPNSTISINCFVDKDKYSECDGDKDKCDEVIRQDMNKDGNFNSILNVMSAVKQESEDLFDACLNYPSTYSPQEIEGNLARYGYSLEDSVTLIESLEHVLDTEIDLDEDDLETDEEILARTAEENNVTIEVHSNSLETPIEYYGLSDVSVDDKEVVRIFKSYDEESEENVYQPIVKKDGTKRNTDRIDPLRRDNRFNVKVHTNPDVKVLWNLSSELDLSRDICSCIIDYEIVDMWPEKFEELKTFIDENERTPSHHSKQIIENQIGNWFSSQKQNYKINKGSMKNKTKCNMWIKFLEEYKEYLISTDDKWFNNFNELKTFISKNKQLPSTSIQIQNKIIHNLGRWLSIQQQRYASKTEGMKDADRYNLWTQFLEDYKEYFISDDEKWIQKFESLKTFIDKNKRTPSQKKNEEKKLSKWLSHQQTNYKDKKNSMKDEALYNLYTQFLEDYKEYFISTHEKWFYHFDKLKMFIMNNKKKPSAKSKNVDIQFIGSWLDVQKKDYKQKVNGMQDEVRYNLWTQFLEEYKDYLLTGQDIWFLKFEELKTFVNANGRRPFQTSENQNEKQLGVWRSRQTFLYKNKKEGMKDASRYNLWTQFLEEYKEYFDDTSSAKSESTIEDDDEEIIIKIKPKQKKSAKLPKVKEIKEEEVKVETKEDIRLRTKPLITQYHNKFCKMRSDNLAQHFQHCPNDFVEYHRVRDECFKSFEDQDIPCNRVIMELEKIKSKRGGKRVVDMGCGTAKIAEHFSKDNRFQFTNYDHVSINDSVEVCDISNMPLDDDSIEICIMSLALWGSNCEEYIQEANRVLETDGTLYIIDSTKRWSEEYKQDGDRLKQLLERNNFKIEISNIDKFCLFKCKKN
jgi:superfamily II DNA or RNA helicase